MRPLPRRQAASKPCSAPLCCSLGCPKNTVDGEVLLGDLFRSGFEITDAQDEVRWLGQQGPHVWVQACCRELLAAPLPAY